MIVFLVCIVNGKEGKGNQTQKIFVLFLVAKSTEATGRRKAARHSFGGHSITTWTRRGRYLKSINSNFTLAVHSPKLNKAKTHFLSHIGEKNEKNMARPGFEPTISRSEVGRANHYSIGHLFEVW